MLQLRPNCECCNRDLPADSPEARICSFECTFCSDCAAARLHGLCPNCGGELVAGGLRTGWPATRPRPSASSTRPAARPRPSND